MSTNARMTVQGMVWVLAFGLAGSVRAEKWLSPEDVVATPDGARLYVTEHTAKQVAVVEVAGRKLAGTIALKAEPTGLALSTNGAVLGVTVGVAEGYLQLVNTVKGKVADTIEVGHSPRGPVFAPGGQVAYVCNQFLNSVAVVDLKKGEVAARIPVVREPIAAVLSADGGLLFVANQLPYARATNDYVAAVISVIDTAARKTVAAIALPNGSSSVRGITRSADGRFVYVTHTLSRYQLPTTQLERGWMNTSAISIIDAAGKTLVNTVLLDDVDLGAANPCGVACSADGKTLVVAHAGTRELSVIDRVGLHAKIDKVAKGEKVSEVSQKPEDVPNDLSFLVDLRERIRLPGEGPRGVVVVGDTAYAAQYFSDALATVKLGARGPDAVGSLALGPAPKPDLARRGEMLFNDATMCFQQWQSCISCHPGDRADGLNWDLLNDGIGNPKQTKSLLLSHRTPPAMISGIRESAEKAVRSGMKFIQFTVRPEEDALAIDAYCKSLTPVASPYLDDGSLSRAAKRGAKLFKQVGCAQCHPEPMYTDLKEYDVGTGTDNEAGRHFDTPALVEIWRTGPYLYDGRAVDMKDVLTRCNVGDKHGKTSGLKPSEVEDLVTYILSL